MAMSPLKPKLLAVAVAVAAALPCAQAAQAAPAEPGVPGRIAVTDGSKLFLVGHARGVQIYTCNPAAGAYAWSAATPRADLLDDRGRVIIKHFGGPAWQAGDGSKVVGRRVDGVIVDATAIPWLLLDAAQNYPGADGDRLTGTNHIQRTNTTGGLTPATADCDAATAGLVVEVPYTADYWFWKPRGD